MKLIIFLCLIFVLSSNAACALGKSSQITWLDVAKSRWIVSGEISDIRSIKRSDYFEFTLSKINFLKGENYTNSIKIRSASTRIPLINQNNGKRVIVMLNYHRAYKQMDIVTSKGVYAETETILKSLAELIQLENKAMMDWNGFNETNKLETSRGYILGAIISLANKDKFSDGIKVLFELPLPDLKYLIYEMNDLNKLAVKEVSFDFLRDGSKKETKTCAVKVVFDVIDCVLKRRLSYSPYPSISSRSEIERRWIKFKGWLVVASQLQ